MAEIIIEFKNFKKSFGTKQVHKGVNFTVEKGQCMGLIGGSGCGKSVLLRSIIGLEKPDSGEVRVLNENISNWSEKQLVVIRKQIAYAFQGGALFDSMTVYENLAYPLREHTTLSEEVIGEKIKQKLAEFGLSGNENLFPASLSGGMQKRLGIARSIIMDPPIILYDEPTAGLDPYNTKKIQEMILRLKHKGITSILVTHDMATAYAVCDKFALILNGVIATEGPLQVADSKKGSLIYNFTNGEQVSS